MDDQQPTKQEAAKLKLWPNCGETQCRQVHDLLNALGARLGIFLEEQDYAAIKTVQILVAIERLECPFGDPEALITEDWLKEVGFRWHQLERQPSKIWTLWLGECTRTGISSFEDLGIEICDNQNYPKAGSWSVFLRADMSHRYSRFIHIRYIYTQAEAVALIEALTGQKWNPANNLYGSMRTPEQAVRILAEEKRLDIQWNKEGRKWTEIEKDDTRGRCLPKHYEEYVKSGKEGMPKKS